MPLLRRKKKKSISEVKNVIKSDRQSSFFSDHVIKEFSVAHCSCELYFPEPSLSYDKFGAIKEICDTGDSLTLLWSKQCTVHICEIPNVPTDLMVTLEDTGENCEVLFIFFNKTSQFLYLHVFFIDFLF